MKTELDIGQTLDVELLGSIARGDPHSLSRLYDRYAGILYSVALGILRHPQDAEDLLQEVFLLIWDRAGTYDPNLGRALSWVITLTRNRAIDRLRAAKRKSEVLESIQEEASIWEAVGLGDSATQPVLTQEAAQLVRSAMRELDSDQRRSIELAFFGGLSQSEIATELGVPLGTVKARIRRGMLQMKTILERDLHSNGK